MEKRRVLNAALLGNLTLSIALFVITLFLLGTPYVGFNAFSTAVIYVLYALTAIVILNKAPSAFSIGLLVGSSFVILILSFQNALFWGLIAAYNGNRELPSILASVLHVVIFLIQFGITWVIVRSKEDVIDTYAAYEYIPDARYSDDRSSYSQSNSASQVYQTTAPTADI